MAEIEQKFICGELVRYYNNVCYEAPNSMREIPCVGGEARVVAVRNTTTSLHPYYLVGLGTDTCNVDGWCDAYYMERE